MRYDEFETLISSQRLDRFKEACNNDTRKALRLYRSNIRLSQAFLGVLRILRSGTGLPIMNLFVLEWIAELAQLM